MNLTKMRVSGKNRILVLTAALLACSLSPMRTRAQETAGVEDGLIEEDLQILDGSSNTEVAQETSAALETEEADAGTKKESDVQETEGADGGMTKEPAAQPDAADQIIASMTNEEKAAQLFMVTPEVLTGSWNVTAAGPATAASFDAIPVGGLIYMEGNIQSYAQTQEMLKIAQRSMLYPRIKRDTVIIYCLHNHISLENTQIILQDLGLPLLGGRER